MKRRGFTLIELMVVIAIIIILAAIAIPNYLSMTARAKRSRVASDFAALATALETYRTDWNTYPLGTEEIITVDGTGKGTLTSTAGVGAQLAGTADAGLNFSGTTVAGESAPIEYMTENILKSMKNPYFTGTAAATPNQYKYVGPATVTAPMTWTLTANTGDSKGTVLTRTDVEPTLIDGPST